jgi:hypothetical protein
MAPAVCAGSRSQERKASKRTGCDRRRLALDRGRESCWSVRSFVGEGDLTPPPRPMGPTGSQKGAASRPRPSGRERGDPRSARPSRQTLRPGGAEERLEGTMKNRTPEVPTVAAHAPPLRRRGTVGGQHRGGSGTDHDEPREQGPCRSSTPMFSAHFPRRDRNECSWPKPMDRRGSRVMRKPRSDSRGLAPGTETGSSMVPAAGHEGMDLRLAEHAAPNDRPPTSRRG